MSTNSTLDAGDTLLGSGAVPGLATNATSAGTTPVTIPAGTLPGTYYIFAKADGPGAIAEINETNNTLNRTIVIGRDLTVTVLTAPSCGGAGTTISIGDTTANGGGGPADASTTNFYLSANSTLDASDTLLGSRAVPALSAWREQCGNKPPPAGRRD